MTEQECIAKMEMLEQVNQNIVDLQKTKYNLENEIEKYAFEKCNGRYFRNTQTDAILKAISVKDSVLACISVSKSKDEEYNFTCCYCDIDLYWKSDLRHLEVISEEEFYEYLDEFTEEMKSSIAMR